jgi:hypothetical protein
MSTTTDLQRSFYVASDIKQKRFRRTKLAVARIRDAIRELLEDDNPQTVRQVFYALTVPGIIAKAEIEYQRTAVRLLGEMREAGSIPFEWVADNTRWQRKPTTFTGIEACLNSIANFYRRDLWAAMPVYVEIWLEKDALAGVIVQETEVYDVPLMVARGYSSLSFLHSAARAIEAKGKPSYIYHFGDYDPSGVDAGATSRPNFGVTLLVPKSISRALRLLQPKSRNGTCRPGRQNKLTRGPKNLAA